MWGRSIGAFFYVPAAYFWIRGCLSKAVKKRVAVAGVLLACQGLLGTSLLLLKSNKICISKTWKF
jgi:cytochrome c oxidase assembly protein subunit 15